MFSFYLAAVTLLFDLKVDAAREDAVGFVAVTDNGEARLYFVFPLEDVFLSRYLSL